jgi:steroid delta-isomerase-like uncharacterized protein
MGEAGLDESVVLTAPPSRWATPSVIDERTIDIGARPDPPAVLSSPDRSKDACERSRNEQISRVSPGGGHMIAAPPVQGGTMDHAATMRRMYEALSAGDVDGFGDTIAEDFVDHEELPGLAPTKEGVLAFFRMYMAAFPDLRMDPEDVIAGGDKVVARVRATGTHQGEFLGMPPTGRRVDVQLVDIIRFGDDGLAHEHWGVLDQLSMMQQLGAIPEGPPA